MSTTVAAARTTDQGIVTTTPGAPTTSADVNERMLGELSMIRKLLEPKPPAPVPKGMKNEFIDFLSKYKVMGLAVAFILGIYLGSVVQALVADLIMPIVTLAMPGTSWKTLAAGPFMVGDFAGAVLTFVIVALVIFLVVKATNRAGIE